MVTASPIYRDSQQEAVLIAEINQLRGDPVAYSSMVAAWAARSPDINTAATQEILWYLRSARPVPPLQIAPGLTIVAHKRAQSGLEAAVPLSRQLQPYGKLSGRVGENSSSEAANPQEAIAQWLINAGDPRRQSRQNLLTATWGYGGVYVGTDGQYRVIFAEDYADFSVLENEQAAASDRAVFKALNQLRQNPPSYLPILQEWRDRFLDTVQIQQPDGNIYCTQEGIDAVTEAMQVLENTPPLTALELSWGMTQAARDLVRYQGETGNRGAIGRDRTSPQDRLEQYGIWQGRWAESLCYGQPNAQGVICDLLISDGKLERRDRDYLLNPQWQKIGIATGSHPLQTSVCALLFTQSYRESR